MACGKLFNQLLDLKTLPTYVQAELLPYTPGDAVQVSVTVKEGAGLPALPAVPDVPTIELVPSTATDAPTTTVRALELAKTALEASRSQPAASEKPEVKDLSVRQKTVPIYGRRLIDYSVGGYVTSVRPRSYSHATGNGLIQREKDKPAQKGGAIFFHFYTTKPDKSLGLAFGIDGGSDFKRVNTLLAGPTMVVNLGSPENRMFLTAGLAWTQQTVLDGVSLGENITLKTRREFDTGSFVSLSFALRIKTLGGK